MEVANFILTAISTIAAVVSSIAAVTARNEVKSLRNQIAGNKNIQNTGEVSVKNNGKNEGIMLGVTTGEAEMRFVDNHRK